MAMRPPIPRPPAESERLRALRTYDPLDSATGEAIGDLTRLAAEICAAPWASINFVDEQRTRFIVPIGGGFPVQDMSRDLSFCAGR